MKKFLLFLLLCGIGFGAFAFMSGMFNTVTDEYGNEYSVWFSKLTLTESASETTMVIPSEIDGKTVVAIGEDAFNNNSTITSLTLPSTLEKIELNGLGSMKELASISIDGESDYYTVSNNVLYNNEMTILVKYPSQKTGSSFTIPSTVTSLSEYSFSENENIINVSLPDKLETIGSSSFSKCYYLTSITIPQTVTSIGSAAFSNAISLDSANIPQYVTEISDLLFSGCRSLRDLEIHEDIQYTRIGYQAFYNCNYTRFDHFVLPKSCTEIDSFAFTNCYMFFSIYLSNEVKTVKKSAFDGCLNVVINVEAEERPSGWSETWSVDSKEIVFGYTL